MLLAVPILATGTAGAAIAPPWCGTPSPDAAANLPDGSSPAHPAGSFPHIPYYAIGCTLDNIAAASGGRMTVERFGTSALGRDKFLVIINALDTKSQRRDYSNWSKVRRHSLADPERAQDILDRVGDDVKVPLYIQGGIHGNEYEGVDASMQIIERLATTPYGSDPEVDQILDESIVIFNPIQNPDGRIAGTRANGNGFDLNRDFLTQSQPETHTSVAIMQEFLPPEMLDLHGYVSPTLIEATTKPHNPGIEYDLWLKWNQSRIDANEAAMNAQGFDVTRPINDWCWDGDIPVGGICTGDGSSRPYDWGPKWAESWDDWGPFYTPMYSQLVGLNGSTVEMCNNATLNPTGNICGPGANTYAKVGRSGSRMHQYITVWSSLLFDTENRVELMEDQLEIYVRGEDDAPRPPLSSFPDHPTDQSRQFRNEENYWMIDYPQAFVIPKGDHQRSDPEARRLVRWLLANGIEVRQLKKGYQYNPATRFEQDSWVVFMEQPLRGLAYTSLGLGQDISDRISILYAPPGAWSHGALWGADVVEIPDAATFNPDTQRVRKVWNAPGGVDGGRDAVAFALALDSPTAVRTLNDLLDSGLDGQLAMAPFTNAFGKQMPAGTVLFPASAQSVLDDAGDDSGVWFVGVKAGGLPAVEPIDRSPRIAVLTAAVNQDVWVLRNLGFTADPISTAAAGALNNPAGPNPLDNYDVVFNTAGWPAGATARSRLTAFFAAGGGYIGANANGANFLVSAGQVAGLAAQSDSGGGSGWSGIVTWLNSGSGTSLITGAYRNRDTAIMDPPTWFNTIPAGWTGDASLPLALVEDWFLSGLFPPQATSGAAGKTVVAHGLNAGGTSRMTNFAMNPMYRADPEREWPMISSAALWADQ
ncbi:MAG: succinylglutamate desuccinylase/aspartoacylase family protein [Actinomycetota bacterium]|nr:succinylglutamate desuccinylase/aspartoacylase family protein [Actinomycetota bacterium]